MISSHFIEIEGWAFIEGHDVDSELSRTYIVLKSDRQTYIFDTAPMARPDVAKAFEALNLSLNWAGFATVVPLREIAEDEYILGIHMKKGELEALQYTRRVVEF